MKNDVTYKMGDVTNRLSAKIANLEVQLAHAQAANDAYKERISELKNKKETDKDELTNRKKK